MDYIKLITSTEYFRIRPEEIAFIEADGNYVNIVTTGGFKARYTLQLAKMAERINEIEGHHFFRVGKSLIVNKDYVRIVNLTSQEITILCPGQNPRRLSASRDALKELIENLKLEGGKL